MSDESVDFRVVYVGRSLFVNCEVLVRYESVEVFGE
jgi:hypothetical protein